MYILVALQLSLLVATSMAHSTGPRTSTCEDFHVSHVGSVEANENVTVIMTDVDGNVVTCWQSQGLYNVELKNRKHSANPPHEEPTAIKGFMLRAYRGTFPKGKTSDLPSGTRAGPCQDSVSHRESLTSRSPPLIFGYKAPRSSRAIPIRFRYTVVFDFYHVIENKEVIIPFCTSPTLPIATSTSTLAPTPPTTTPTVAPTMTPTPTPCNDEVTGATTTETNDGDDYKGFLVTQEPATTDPPTEPPTVSHVCGKNLTLTNKVMPYEEEGIRYTCQLNKTITQVQCQETCENGGRQLCCDIKNRIMRKKLFVCIACSDVPEGHDLYKIYRTMTIEVRNSCKCWDCTDSN